MAYTVTQRDLRLLKQPIKQVYIKLELINMYNSNAYDFSNFNSWFTPNGVILGSITDGSCTITNSSDIRRTMNLTMVVTDDSYGIGYDKKIWLDTLIRPYIGIKDLTNGEIVYYPLGIFVITDGGYSYSADTNSLSLNLSDLICLLNGDRNGVIGAMNTMTVEHAPAIANRHTYINHAEKKVILMFIIPNYTVNRVNGNPVYYDRQVGFTIPLTFLTNRSCRDYDVYVCINPTKKEVEQSIYGCYPLRKYNYPHYEQGEIIKVKDLIYLKEYCCNFYGNSVLDYTFSLLGEINTIKNVIVDTLKQFTPFRRYMVTNVGEENDTLTTKGSYVPYDLTFTTNSKVYDVIKKCVELYPGYESFFDEDGVFITQRIPTCEDSNVVLDEENLKGLVISEDCDYDFKSVYNVTEVFGKVIDFDRYDKNSSITFDHTNRKIVIDVHISLYGYDSNGKKNNPYVYIPNENIGFLVKNISDSDRQLAADYPIYVRINHDDNVSDNLPEILLINDYTTKKQIHIDSILSNITYGFKPYLVAENSKSTYYAVYVGQYQVHAICMLVDKEPSDEIKARHKKDNNCDQISYIVNEGEVTTYTANGEPVTEYLTENCPYTVEKLGEIRQVLSDGDYSNIYTNELARQRAELEEWKAGRLTDSTTIETILIPFLSVNQKIKYKSVKTHEVGTYITDEVSFNFNDFKTNIKMHKLYHTDPAIIHNHNTNEFY